jgi:uncharacterized membrane protein YdjX (TVP38/TMEM64 family)
MKALTHLLLGFVWRYGGVSLLLVGVLDSSFLFLPLGNDLLVIALTARMRSIPHLAYYAGMSTVGSILGSLLVDLLFRKAGEEGLEKHLSGRRLDYVKSKITNNASWALALAAIAPPPFPFTAIVMAASALQYPRKKLLTVIGAVRMIRFTGLGVLALYFGDRIISWGSQESVQRWVFGLLVLFLAGSTLSVIQWIRRSRRLPQPASERR